MIELNRDYIAMGLDRLKQDQESKPRKKRSLRIPKSQNLELFKLQ